MPTGNQVPPLGLLPIFYGAIDSVSWMCPFQTYDGYTARCPLPLDTFLDHAWSTEGLVGAVPWVADFMRMMKWDEVSVQVFPFFC